MPVMAAPMAGAAYNLGGAMEEAELARALHEGCAGAGTIAWCGDGANPDFLSLGLDAIAARQGRGIPTIKPRGLDALLARIRLAETAGALAVAVDVDTAGFFSMTSQGQPVGPLSPETLSVLAGSTKLPLIVKGVMTPDEAVVAMNAGAAGIVVSNHGGRVLEACPGTAAVLPAIAAEVRGRAPLLMDGGIRSGADVLKALALGADAVLVGRPLIVAAAGGGAEGVALYLNNLRADLASAMVLTGTADVRDVPPRVVTRNAS
jgi:isopentenyl diphosphate isomerase/L-lactate dehydrogenase-like FMN-dependent dehydrogenase